MSIYFKYWGHGILRALRKQKYTNPKGRTYAVSGEHIMGQYYVRAASHARYGDIYEVPAIKAVPNFAGYRYEPHPYRNIGRRVARLKHEFTPEELKQKRREKSHH